MTQASNPAHSASVNTTELAENQTVLRKCVNGHDTLRCPGRNCRARSAVPSSVRSGMCIEMVNAENPFPFSGGAGTASLCVKPFVTPPEKEKSNLVAVNAIDMPL